MEGRQSLFLFGDAAYNEQPGIISSFYDRRGHRWLPDVEREFNHIHSRIRVAIDAHARFRMFCHWD